MLLLELPLLMWNKIQTTLEPNPAPLEPPMNTEQPQYQPWAQPGSTTLWDCPWVVKAVHTKRKAKGKRRSNFDFKLYLKSAQASEGPHTCHSWGPSFHHNNCSNSVQLCANFCKSPKLKQGHTISTLQITWLRWDIFPHKATCYVSVIKMKQHDSFLFDNLLLLQW